jgi:hypothetical protein
MGGVQVTPKAPPPIARLTPNGKKLLQHLADRDGRPEYAVIDEALILYAKTHPKQREPIPSKAGRPKTKEG